MESRPQHHDWPRPSRAHPRSEHLPKTRAQEFESSVVRKGERLPADRARAVETLIARPRGAALMRRQRRCVIIIQKLRSFRLRDGCSASERFRLDLADALAVSPKTAADFLQRVIGVHADAEPHAQHASRAAQRREHPRRRLAQIRLYPPLDRQHRVLVLDENRPRCESPRRRSASPARSAPWILEHLAHFFQRHGRAFPPAPPASARGRFSCSIWREVRTILLIVSIISRECGSARLIGAIERVIACLNPPRRIVENL